MESFQLVECDDWVELLQIERDEADFVAPSNYGCFHGRGTVAVCSPGSQYLNLYWFSKYPDRTPPTWNLLKLVDPTSWIMIFISLLFVTIFFFISARIGKTQFRIETFHQEIILSPFRKIKSLKLTDISVSWKLKLIGEDLIWCISSILEFNCQIFNNHLVLDCPPTWYSWCGVSVGDLSCISSLLTFCQR